MSAPEDTRRNPDDFPMKEILTRFVLPRLESIDAKLDKKADAAELASLQVRVELVERTYVTREEKHKIQNDQAAENKLLWADIGSVQSWRNRIAGALALVVAVLIPLVAIVLSNIRHL